MGTSNKEDLSKYVKTVYTAENATPLGSRVCVPNNSAQHQLNNLLKELKQLKENRDSEEISLWIDKTIRSLEGAPALHNLIQKVKGS
jgi:hypothetical protein